MSLRRPVFVIAILLLLGWSAMSAIAEDGEDTHVRARLVADTAHAGPGSTFRLGVRFEIEDGWHVYWRNPGGAGLATAVDFELPDGVTAGPLRWPLPIAFDQGGGIHGYGYEGSVVLAAEISLPAGLDNSGATKVRAATSWLACKDVCVLGSAELEGSLAELPVDPDFGEWERRLPRMSTDSKSPFTVTAKGSLASGRVTHWLRWRQAPQLVEWFPDPSPAIEVKDVRVETRGGLTRIDAALRRRKGADGMTNDLESLVVVTDGDGTRTGWRLRVDLNDQHNSRSAP